MIGEREIAKNALVSVREDIIRKRDNIIYKTHTGKYAEFIKLYNEVLGKFVDRIAIETIDKHIRRLDQYD